MKIELQFINKARHKIDYDLTLNSYDEPPLDRSRDVQIVLKDIPKNFMNRPEGLKNEPSEKSLPNQQAATKTAGEVNSVAKKKKIDNQNKLISPRSVLPKSPPAPAPPKSALPNSNTKKSEHVNKVSDFFGSGLLAVKRNSADSGYVVVSDSSKNAPKAAKAPSATNQASTSANSTASPARSENSISENLTPSPNHAAGKSLDTSNSSNENFVAKENPPQSSTSPSYDVLQQMYTKISSMSDAAALKKIIELVEQAGKVHITSSTYDFDLCDLDNSTLIKLKNILEI